MSKTDLITLKDPNSFQLRGVDIDVYCVDGHVQQIWLAGPDGEKFVIKSAGYLDLYRVEPGSVLDIPIE